MKKLYTHMLGFTLIELLAVMFIIGAILSIAVPAFGPMLRTTKIKEDAKLIYKTLEYARQYAAANGTDCMVVFDNVTSHGGGIGYKVFVPEKGDIEDWAFLGNGVGVNISTMDNGTIPNDGDGDGSVKQVTFTSRGIPSSMGTIQVIDSSGSSGIFRQITYSNVSGHTRLYDVGE